MTQQTVLPLHLLDSIQGRKCILFAGAGLSAAVGLPCWNHIVSLLIDEVVRVEPGRGLEFKERYDNGYLMQSADYAKNELGQLAYFDLLNRTFSGPFKPHITHHLLTQIPFRGIITTNFDKMFETCYTLRYESMPTTFTSLSMSALASVLFRNRFFIFKLHGDIDYPESIILTRQDFDRIIFNSPHVKSFLQSLFSQNTILYVGYSLNDQDFDLILSELSLQFAGNTPPHYALLPNPDHIKSQDIRKRMNIRVLPYDPSNNHAELSYILEIIKNHCNSAEERR